MVWDAVGISSRVCLGYSVPVGSEMLPLGCWDLDLGSRLRTWGAGAKGLEPGSVWESLVFYGWYPEKGLKESGI